MGNLNSQAVIEPPSNLSAAPNHFDVVALYSKVGAPNNFVVAIIMAPYCSASRDLNAALPKLATEFPMVTFIKVNTEKETDIPTKFNVNIFPHTSIVYKKDGGDPAEQSVITGNKPDEIRQILKELTKPPEVTKQDKKKEESDSE